LLVANKSNATASFFPLLTDAIEKTLPTGTGPHEAATSGDEEYIVVTDYSSRSPSTITVLSAKTQQYIKTISLGAYQAPHGVMFLNAYEHVIVTVENSQAVVMVDLVQGFVFNAVSTAPLACHMVVVDSLNRFAYASSISGGGVAVIDMWLVRMTKIVQTGAGAEGIDISPDGTEVWVTNREPNTVSIISTTSHEVIDSFNCGLLPIRVKFTLDGSLALISAAVSGEIVVVEARTRSEVTRINLGIIAVPVGILVVSPDCFLVACTQENRVVAVSLQSFEIERDLEGFLEPDGMTLVSGSNF